MQKTFLALCAFCVLSLPISAIALEYTVQIAAYDRVVPAADAQYRLREKVPESRLVEENGMTKLHAGRFTNQAEANRYSEQLKAMGIDSMVRPYTEGNSLPRPPKPTPSPATPVEKSAVIQTEAATTMSGLASVSTNDEHKAQSCKIE